MPRLSFETRVDCPPDQVWEFVTDLEQVPKWVWFTDEMLHIEGGGKGCHYTERGPLGHSSWDITEVIKGRREVHVGRVGPGVVELTNEVVPDQGRTVFRQTVDFRAFPRFRPLGWIVENTVMRIIMQWGMRRTTPNVKRILESD